MDTQGNRGPNQPLEISDTPLVARASSPARTNVLPASCRQNPSPRPHSIFLSCNLLTTNTVRAPSCQIVEARVCHYPPQPRVTITKLHTRKSLTINASCSELHPIAVAGVPTPAMPISPLRSLKTGVPFPNPTRTPGSLHNRKNPIRPPQIQLTLVLCPRHSTSMKST